MTISTDSPIIDLMHMAAPCVSQWVAFGPGSDLACWFEPGN